MSVRQAKNHGDHRNRTEALLRVINLKTWETKMHIALTASHDLGSRAFRFHAVRLIGIELFVSPSMKLTHMVPTGHHWHWHVMAGCEPVPKPNPSRRKGLRVNPLTYPLGVCRWVALGGRPLFFSSAFNCATDNFITSNCAVAAAGAAAATAAAASPPPTPMHSSQYCSSSSLISASAKWGRFP